jgi:hypothetical protein
MRPGDNFCLHCGQRHTEAAASFTPPWPWGHAPSSGAEPETAAPAHHTSVAFATPSFDAMRPNMSQPPRFTWKTTDGATHDFEMTATEISIGRAPTCDIVLNDDQMVSRRHAMVRRQGSIVTVVDLGSSNGTLINGSEIHDAPPLTDGDHLTIGDYDLIFTVTDNAAVAPGTPVVETIRIGGASTPVANGASSSYAGATSGPATYNTPFAAPVPPTPLDGGFATPSYDAAPFEAIPVAASPTPAMDAVVEQDTGAMGVSSGYAHASYVHTVNGKEVESADAVSDYQNQVVMGSESVTVAPQRQDAVALLATIQRLHAQLNEQIADADHMADIVRDRVRAALSQLEAALNAAQSSTQQAALADLRQIADNVSQSQQFDHVANLTRRAGEISDVLAAHQALLNALLAIRQQLQDAVSK